MTRIRLAAAQIVCAAGDIATNLQRHAEAIAAARAQRVDVLVFPELSLTDYESRPDIAALARDADGRELRHLAEQSRGMTVAVGLIERNPAGRPFNTCAVLADGRVTHLHRKINLPTYGALVEGEVYAPGDTLALCATPLGPTACLVCADTWNPSLPWLVALSGAQALLVPIASARGVVAPAFDSCENWIVNLRHTAMTYGLPIVMTNHCGRRGGLDFWGGSMILDASGRIAARAGEEPDLLVAEIDVDAGAIARTLLPTVRDAAPAFVQAALGRLLDVAVVAPSSSA